jgi:nucleotide-binding universal stress UspA family protein
MNWPGDSAIVVPIDFSAESFRALDEALAMAAAPSQVHVVHVMDELTFGRCQALGQDALEIERLQLKQSLREWLPEDKYRQVPIDISCGDPGREIAKFAMRVEASLIVMPSHGRGGPQPPLAIGSVAERVVRLAHCPVLILKHLSERSAEPCGETSEFSHAGAAI